MMRHWKSWLTIFTMSEDDNEGVFGPPPPTGNVDPHLPADARPRPAAVRADRRTPCTAGRSPTPRSRSILEKDGLAKVMPWTNDVVGAYTVHPLASCRIGDDPNTSALDDNHELRGHPGIFVTDGSAVPGALTVNPAMTIAALAERAVPAIVRAAQAPRGRRSRYGAPAPDGATAGRRAVLQAR